MLLFSFTLPYNPLFCSLLASLVFSYLLFFSLFFSSFPKVLFFLTSTFFFSLFFCSALLSLHFFCLLSSLSHLPSLLFFLLSSLRLSSSVSHNTHCPCLIPFVTLLSCDNVLWSCDDIFWSHDMSMSLSFLDTEFIWTGFILG